MSNVGEGLGEDSLDPAVGQSGKLMSKKEKLQLCLPLRAMIGPDTTCCISEHLICFLFLSHMAVLETSSARK